MTFDEKLDRVVAKLGELADRLAELGGDDPKQMAQLSKEYAALSPVVDRITALRSMQAEYAEASELATDGDADAEMRELAAEETDELRRRLPEMEHDVRLLLVPRDEADARNAILEVRAGTGGDEAALFAAELLRMYQRFAEVHGWRFELMEYHDTGLGGLKEAMVTITGKDVFARLKFESGVHRVQRVPVTESGGRIHTSAATVAVLPEAAEVDVQIEDKDLRIDTYRAQGAGGQHVNTTDSAVRITHLPSGVVVQCQDEKSQHKNRAKAMKVLRARLYEFERKRREAERAAERKTMVGSGDRSERIRTYNFPQGRVTDHRINLTLYKLDQVLSGASLDELIDALVTDHQAALLAEAV